MKLYFNGCSHTVGICSDLHDIEQTYPYKLSKALNADFINSALPRSSNDRIFRTTVEDICSLEKIPDIAIIQWTYYQRFETPMLTGEYKKYILPWEKYRTRDLEWKQFSPYVDIRNGTTNNPIEIQWEDNKVNAVSSFFTKVMTLDSFLESKNIRPVHIFFPTSKFMRKDNGLIKTLLGNCNSDNFLNSPFIGIESYLDDFGLERGADDHFVESGHEKISEWLFNFISYNLPIQHKYKTNSSIKEDGFIYEE